MEKLKIVEYSIAIAMIIVMIFAYKVASEEKMLYEQCNRKILCENNKLPEYYCKGYNNTFDINFTLNIT